MLIKPLSTAGETSKPKTQKCSINVILRDIGIGLRVYVTPVIIITLNNAGSSSLLFKILHYMYNRLIFLC